MSALPNRRTMLMAGAGLGALILGAASFEAWRLLGSHYPSTPYDDLLDLLPDREAAKKIGAAYISDHPSFDVVSAARKLRQRIGTRSLAEVLESDSAGNRLAEAAHWIMPDTLALLCAMAAKAKQAVS